MTLRAGVCRSVLQRHTAPPTLGARLAVDQRQMRAHEECPPVDSEVVFFAPASVVVMLWAAIAAFSKPHGPAWRALERLIAQLVTTSSSAPAVAAMRTRTASPSAPGHHLRGIHQGRVRAWGTAPDDVTWELGVRPGRAPLLRLHGDVYVGAG